ncbi:putative phosphatidylinositol-4-phosphate 5-kinase [Trypanosoma cruzi]|uniref:Phosphatidylinositol-4-phosphate 5-kinase, putative n=2 Tax=Trypanosoma cruzi TaxID=5693 RepID=Q4D5V0_TRYCC|nr:phosphatidylinositol-4-phosphate 5-kinase, putative [Trypanosoma cruzi]EAN87892.1 phosphatidylinositol-4-phosphate 5-kinase, putative [Trypanosoma cruzi]RNC43915.1 putative phosphatidylinositol-4-phosphate 5-kinase [Trypanosoma cruzi]|eukprot:XP_809743.1 phosphatidylinositol-4-phosphate 5-kinase [Trypanosoma cruzi strain CL Brener]
MGGIQSVGGAATSGHGFTGKQVSGALAAAADAQRKSHRERLKAEEDLPRAVRRTVSGVIQTLDEIGREKYQEKRVLQFQVPDSEGNMGTVTVHEYAPEVFRFLRQLDGLGEDMFADEWTLPEDRLALELGEGRSMALFLKSKSMDLMCKTIAEEEVNVLLKLLPQYTEHLSRNTNTLLMRFSMLLRIEAGAEVGFILCFGDVFAPCRTLNEKWDLKGRIPKPGKYQHFPKLIQRPYEPNPYLIETPRDTIELPELVGSQEERVVVVEAADKDKLATRKDKDLTRLFWLERHERNKLIRVLMKDYEFLGNAGMMDYSLLIGVAYNETKVSRSGKLVRSMRMTYPMGSERDADLAEVRPASLPRRCPTPHDFRAGITSLQDQEIYYIGIIDMLTKYTWKKKTANFFKKFLWKPETLSTIPPVEYRKRISKYTKIIFPDVNATDNTTKPSC